MKIKIKTLIDITNTGARRGETPHRMNQQQNYLTFLQTLGLRSNFDIDEYPTVDKETTKDFGSNYKGRQNVWTVVVDLPFEGALTEDMLLDDFDLVPFISNLDETVKFHTEAFSTTDNTELNIRFLTIE